MDHPEEVQVKSVDGSQVTVLELRVHPEDLGKVIGRQGRTAKAVRTLLGAAGMKVKKTLHTRDTGRLSAEAQRWVIVARILRPRGNKGEVAAQLLTDFPERLTKLTEVFLGASGRAGAEPRLTALKACWLSQNHKGQAVFHFEGCNSISEAEKFRGLDVLLPIESRAKLSAGQYFLDDLVGCLVFENFAEAAVVSSSPCSLASAPSLLGVVKEVQIPGEGVAGTPLLSSILLVESFSFRSLKIFARVLTLPNGESTLCFPMDFAI